MFSATSIYNYYANTQRFSFCQCLEYIYIYMHSHTQQQHTYTCTHIIACTYTFTDTPPHTHTRVLCFACFVCLHVQCCMLMIPTVITDVELSVHKKTILQSISYLYKTVLFQNIKCLNHRIKESCERWQRDSLPNTDTSDGIDYSGCVAEIAETHA